MKRPLALVLALVLAVSACARAQDEDAKPKDEKAAAGEAAPEPRKFESTGSVTANGKNIRYKAIAEETYILDDKNKPRASIFLAITPLRTLATFTLCVRRSASISGMSGAFPMARSSGKLI